MPDHSIRFQLLTGLAWLFFTACLPAQQLTPGQLIPRMTCQAKPDTTYALYLPSTFTPGKNMPLLLCFDPGGTGTRPVEIFRAAAEQHGWMVAGSNDVKNGPWKDNAPHIDALWRELMQRLPVDTKRIYTTGFSGGARVALALAWSKPGAIAGVIACGAGMPPGASLDQSFSTAIIGVIGERDFNLMELKILDRELGKLTIPRRLLIFDGYHQWPPPESILVAVSWLEFHAIRKELRPRDPQLEAGMRQEREERAKRLEAEGSLPAAYRELEALARDLDGMTDAASIQSGIVRLLNLSGYQKALRNEEKLDSQERENLASAIQVLDASFKPGSLPPDAGQLAKELKVDDLRKKAYHPKTSPAEARGLKRVLNLIISFCYQQDALENRPADPKRVIYHQLVARILPDRPDAHFNLACVYVETGQPSAALTELETAIACGFKDAAQLQSEPRLAPLQSLPAFQELLARVKGMSPEAAK